MNRIIAGLALFFMATAASAAGFTGDLGGYSKYVNGINGVAGKWKEPAIQGSLRYTTENGWYGDGWFSQSTRAPGLGETFANEADLMVGKGGRLGERWSYDLHVAYYDIVNSKLLDGINGDILNPGGTLRYHWSPSTSFFTNVERYDGIGERGFKGGWRLGVGMSTTIGPASVSGTLFDDINFLRRDAKYAKIVIEPTAPMAKFAGGEVRPVLFLWQPIGAHDSAHGFHAVGAIRWSF